ncbi:MAG: hypothetical protein E4H14_15800 [Candidatus Thorarchaeota archaeon]|nr:MAG: hypothetical protein E4H14_15800 [Candidatus Thorarchaeota archaeon]
METRCISKTDILQSTLFHIQVKQCQYIDNFPEAVATIIDTAVGKRKLKDYDTVKRKLYCIRTNFFIINQIKKKDFFEGLYTRLQNKTR